MSTDAWSLVQAYIHSPVRPACTSINLTLSVRPACTSVNLILSVRPASTSVNFSLSVLLPPVYI